MSVQSATHKLDGPIATHTRIAASVVGRRTVVHVAGEIDVDTAPALTEAIDAALENGALELWVDLTQVAFMDSSGLHALWRARRRALALNRRLAIICPGGPVRRLFDIAGLLPCLPVYADLAQAHRAA